MTNSNIFNDPPLATKAHAPQVSVVIGSYQRLNFLKLTIESIRNELKGLSHEIIVVDGGSADGTLEWLIQQKDILLIIQHNRGKWKGVNITRKSWGYFMNLGFKSASGKFICMLSDDCLLLPGAITNGIAVFEKQLALDKRVGAGAFYWRNWPEQTEYRIGLTWGNVIYVNHGLYLNEALREINYADELSYIFYHADGDICLRLKEACYESIGLPTSFVEHFAHAGEAVRTSNNLTQQTDWKNYEEKWSFLGQPKIDWLTSDYIDSTGTYKTFLKIWNVRLLMSLFPIAMRLKSHKSTFQMLIKIYKKIF